MKKRDNVNHISSVQLLSHVRLFATPWTAACQASLSIPNSGTCSNSCPLSWGWHSTVLSSIVPLSSCLQSFPASGSFPMSQFLHQEAKVLEFQLQHQSFIGRSHWKRRNKKKRQCVLFVVCTWKLELPW